MVNHRNFRKIDDKQAKRVSRGLSDLAGVYARPVCGSGSDWRAKGDVTSSLFLIEDKDKAKPSKQRTVHREIFDKIRMEALAVDKMPLYVIGFGDGDDFMILRDKDFYHIVGRMVDAEKRVQALEAGLKAMAGYERDQNESLAEAFHNLRIMARNLLEKGEVWPEND
jgi:hypothetical protein